MAFVVPRYGPGVVGGAETLARLLAEQLVARGHGVDVLTTCATDHFTWANALPQGYSRESGVGVHRFPVAPRDGRRHQQLHGAIARGFPATYAEQVEWMATSVFSRGLLTAAASYDWLIALPYLFGTTFWSTVAHPARTVLMPCLHDEQHAHQSVVIDALTSARGIMANAAGEKRLIERLLRAHPQSAGSPEPNEPTIVGAGFDDAERPDKARVAAFRRRHSLPEDYLLYAGRREQEKGLDDLFDFYRAFRRESSADAPALVLMGTGDLATPDDLTPYVVDLGFIDLADRATVYAGASVLIQPSRLESFGMVLFEAWLAGTPVLVNSASEVLHDHIDASAGGLAYGDADEFAVALEILLGDAGLRTDMATAGRAYTLEEFGWGSVIERFTGALARWR